MRMTCLSLVSAAVILCQAQAGFAGTVIDQFVILVHPCPYEYLGYRTTDPFPNGAYRTLENAARQRWFDAIPSMPQSTFVVEVDWAAKGPSPDVLHQGFVDRLGVGRVCRIPFDNYYHNASTPVELKADYAKIDQQIRQQIAIQGLTFNAATATTSIWGQSFEGCASGYGSAIPYYLGLKTPTQFDYNMSAPDAPFLLTGTYLQTVPVSASDVQAYLFDLNDGRYAAFFRSALTPQWLDHRPINLQLNSDFSVLTKTGAVVWEGTGGAQLFTLSTYQERFVVGTNMPDLMSVVNGATVVPEPMGFVLLASGMIILLACHQQLGIRKNYIMKDGLTAC